MNTLTLQGDRRIGLVESAWIFTRGNQSVRIVRVTDRDGSLRLMVDGPGPLRATLTFDDMLPCMLQQAEIERRLVARHFSLNRYTGERRSGRDRRARSRGADRRRS